ncbi:MAG: coiled coil domain-containing protein [Candidatus Eisenbacteria bacterium]
MDERNEYQEKHRAELTQLNRDIGKLKPLARRAKADARAGCGEQVKHLEQKLDSAQEKMGKLRASSGDAWEGLRSGAEKAMGELKAGVKEAWRSLSAD